jgi:hypothetical protein
MCDSACRSYSSRCTGMPRHPVYARGCVIVTSWWWVLTSTCQPPSAVTACQLCHTLVSQLHASPAPPLPYLHIITITTPPPRRAMTACWRVWAWC